MEWRRLLDEYPPSPAAFLDPPPTLREDCLTLLSRLFELTVTSRGSSFPPAPLSQLHCEGFGADEVWEELELVSQPITRYLHRCASGLQKKGTFKLLQEREKDEIRSPPCKDVETETTNSSAGLSLEEEEEEEEEEEDELEKEDMLEEEEEEEGDSDRFFNQSEMEEFVNQAEDEGSLGVPGGMCERERVMFISC